MSTVSTLTVTVFFLERFPLCMKVEPLYQVLDFSVVADLGLYEEPRLRTTSDSTGQGLARRSLRASSSTAISPE